MSTRGHRRSVLAAATTVVLIAFAASCGDDGSDVPLSAAGERGRQIANSNGCAACHGPNGQGGVGPPWVGLAGSEVELIDGSFVVADDAYLVRSIAEPGADLRAGYTLQMPTNSLTESETADIVAYIDDLGAGSGDDAASGLVLSEAGERGRKISNSNGCAACHGTKGQGGIASAFVGLAGSEVELIDGTIVVADDAYLVRAIVDPGADLLAGYSLKMPGNSLSESEVADLIAYIDDLSPESGDG